MQIRGKARPLFRRHDDASRTKYQSLAQAARSQTRILAGSPGTLKQRTQSGNQYWVREHIRVDSAKVDEYFGAVAAVGDVQLAELRSEIDLARSLAAGSGALRLLGFQRIDKKPAAVLAVLFNRGLHIAGLTLVGSHAFGVLLNELGIIAPAYHTEDVDLARGHALALALSEQDSFGSLLNESGLKFAAVPGMPSHKPSASFKLPGAEGLLIDLLVPGAEIGRVIPVPELNSHAQAIPHLDFMVEDPLEAVVLSPNQVVPVKVPVPERFVLHKLYSSQSRRTAPGKAVKDRDQATVIAAALEEDFPGRLAEAWKDFPKAGRSAVRKGARAAAALAESHPEAAAVLKEIGS